MTDFSVQFGDVRDIPSDMLLLKHAQGFYGADKAVNEKLQCAKLCTTQQLDLSRDAFHIIDTNGVIAPRQVMFIGTPNLRNFNYDEMQHFAYRAIEILAAIHPSIRVLTTTVHGEGYGLDGGESLQRLVQGFLDALAVYTAVTIDQIVFLSLGERATRMLASVLKTLNPISSAAKTITPSVQIQHPFVANTVPKTPISSPQANLDKNRAFVAMPFTDDCQNVYEFAIYPAVHEKCGWICEKTNDEFITGDILPRIRSGIRDAHIVIADLTDAHPNVYLEVGYAWALGKPVILLIHKGQSPHFDVASHNRIEYSLYPKLQTDLIHALNTFQEKGLLKSSGLEK